MLTNECFFAIAFFMQRWYWIEPDKTKRMFEQSKRFWLMQYFHLSKHMANYFYYWTKNTAVLKIYMGFDGRDTPILTFSKSKKYLKIFSPSFNIAIKQNIISWDIYRSVSPMQKHVNCGAFGSVDKITCHIDIAG